MDYQKTIDEFEVKLRLGLTQEIAPELNDLNLPRMPHHLRPQFAKIARRVGDPNLGLRILSSIKNDYWNDVDTEAWTEYCMCLKEVGAIYEAQALLAQLETKVSPSTYICKIDIKFNQTDFQGVVDAAQAYLQLFDNDTYEAAIVRINHLAAQIALCNVEQEQEEQLKNLTKWFEKEKWLRLLANSHELYAQLLLQKKQFEEAESEIQKALAIGLSQGLKDHIFIKRWQAVIQARKSNDITSLLEVKELAKSHSETMRAIDAEILKVRFDTDRFNYLYYGTPSQPYKLSLEDSFGEAPQTYVLHPEAPLELSLKTGELNGTPSLTVGGKIHLLFFALLSDFYRPIRVGTLFDEIFPDEFFDAEHSKNRIHQIIFRARQWINKNQLPLEIIESKQQYKLQFNEKVRVILPKKPIFSKRELMLNKLEESFSQNHFTANDAQQVLDTGIATAYRVLSYGISQKRLAQLHDSFYQVTRTSR